MIRFIRNIVSAILLVYIVCFTLTLDDNFFDMLLSDDDYDSDIAEPVSAKSTDPINLICVSCSKPNVHGTRDIDKPLSQALTMIKSAALSTNHELHVHVFTEKDMTLLFEEELGGAQKTNPHLSHFKFTVREIHYTKIPENLRKAWKTWYKPCGSFRLLTPFLLPDEGVHKAIYADSDVVWIRPIDKLWAQMNRFNSQQVMGVAPTAPLSDEKLNSGRIGSILENYVTNEKYIFDDEQRGLYQINTGVLLMNFDKMLNAKWKKPNHSDKTLIDGYSSELLLTYYNKYQKVAEHDQKLMNYIFHFNHELLHPLPCEYNWKTDYCMAEKKNIVCKEADSNGPVAIHGITSAFFGDDHPVLKIMYRVFKEYDWRDNTDTPFKTIGDDLKNALEMSRHAKSYCGGKMRSVIDALQNE